MAAAAADPSEEFSGVCVHYVSHLGPAGSSSVTYIQNFGASSGRGKQCGMCAACIMFSKNETAAQKKRKKLEVKGEG